ncbi:hypothetical protein MiSe_54570 [Microseira wollei NIES-4236]|uniref:Transposase n=1 Tax=Microseira wollei NIES-4236 TaxID=2530354 RepID=A0AAV3XIV0_9CYAN|nr:hypothetical protein MiSe_54570 [Microseira wollei NIES-4236]
MLFSRLKSIYLLNRQEAIDKGSGFSKSRTPRKKKVRRYIILWREGSKIPLSERTHQTKKPQEQVLQFLIFSVFLLS